MPVINAFKSIKLARKFLDQAWKVSRKKGEGYASAKKAVDAWKKSTGHSTTTLTDMARKKSALETYQNPILRSRKYKDVPYIKPKGGRAMKKPTTEEGWAKYLAKQDKRYLARKGAPKK